MMLVVCNSALTSIVPSGRGQQESESERKRGRRGDGANVNTIMYSLSLIARLRVGLIRVLCTTMLQSNPLPLSSASADSIVLENFVFYLREECASSEPLIMYSSRNMQQRTRTKRIGWGDGGVYSTLHIFVFGSIDLMWSWCAMPMCI